MNRTDAKIGKYVFCGRLEEEKGIPFLIDVWKRARPGKLLIFGDGSLRNDVERCANRESVVYRGFQPYAVMERETADAEALIFPSQWYEGYPMSVIESFSRGVPVLASDIGNPGWIVRDGINGYKFRVNDRASFLSALDKVRMAGAKLRQTTHAFYAEYLISDKSYARTLQIYSAIQKAQRKELRHANRNSSGD